MKLHVDNILIVWFQIHSVQNQMSLSSEFSYAVRTDLQLNVIHGVCVGSVELGVVGHVQQLNDQVTGQQLCHKRMLKKEGKHLKREMMALISGLSFALFLSYSTKKIKFLMSDAQQQVKESNILHNTGSALWPLQTCGRLSTFQKSLAWRSLKL